MDPLSITAGIISVAALAAQSAKVAYKAIDGLGHAPQAVAHSKTLLSATTNSLNILTETLKDNQHLQLRFADVLRGIALDKVLHATDELCKRFGATIAKYTGWSTDSKFSNRDKLSITVHESRITKLNTELSDCQRTIDLMTGTITLIVSNNTSEHVQQLHTRFRAQEQALSNLTIELSTRLANIELSPQSTENSMTENHDSNDERSRGRITVLQDSNQAALKVLQQKRTGQTFGDLQADQSMAMQGIVGQARQDVDQSFGKLNATNSSRAFQGQMDAESFARMFNQG